MRRHRGDQELGAQHVLVVDPTAVRVPGELIREGAHGGHAVPGHVSVQLLNVGLDHLGAPAHHLLEHHLRVVAV